MTVGQMVELVVLALMPALAKRVGRKSLLAVGLSAYAMRMALFAYVDVLPAPPMAVLVAGVALHGLTTWWDIIECAEEEKILDAATVKKVTAFLKDPDGWKAP